MLLLGRVVSMVKAMEPLGFESVRSVGLEELRAFVDEREHLGDTNGYELLNGRVVMNPPAGSLHEATR